MLTAITVSGGDFLPVDVRGLNDRVTSSATPQCDSDFRDAIVRRDTSCVITGERECDAAHLIPHAKGDMVMSSIPWIFSDDIDILF